MTTRNRRIPFYARIQLQGAGIDGTGESIDISVGGIGVVVPLKDMKGSTNGTPLAQTVLSLRFRLPGDADALEIRSRPVWFEDRGRNRRGHRVACLGLQFEPGQLEARDRIGRLIDSFRYRVAVLGNLDASVVNEALDDLYEIVELDDLDQLENRNDNHQLGLILVGDELDPRRGQAILENVLNGSRLEREPPIVYCARNLDVRPPALGHVIYMPIPLGKVELRSLAKSCVAGHVLAVENERLNSKLVSLVNRLQQENAFFRNKVAPSRIPGVIGESRSMRKLFVDVERIARHNVSALIVGETGTGKTLIARAIHQLSGRTAQPFISHNCAAIAESLLDSELFGHRRGAFTGADADRIGIIEAADQGTVLLDEVGEMSPAMQAKLLDVLESGVIRRVGENRPIQVSVRVLCATNRDLLGMVNDGTFREDLYYRLGTFVLSLPPLRQRPEDIPLLAAHFLTQAVARYDLEPLSLTQGAVQALEAQSWPGNVRQLRQVIDRLAIVANPGAAVAASQVFEILEQTLLPSDRALDSTSSLRDSLAHHERKLIEKALAESGGVMARAARRLQIERTTLTRRCQRLGIAWNEPKEG